MRCACLLLLGLAACSEQGTLIEQYPDMQSKEFQVYSQNCSACHAPPQPSAHTAAEWPAVITRMQNHRIHRGLGRIMAYEAIMIRDYLIRHARPEGGA